MGGCESVQGLVGEGRVKVIALFSTVSHTNYIIQPLLFDWLLMYLLPHEFSDCCDSFYLIMSLGGAVKIGVIVWQIKYNTVYSDYSSQAFPEST